LRNELTKAGLKDVTDRALHGRLGIREWEGIVDVADLEQCGRRMVLGELNLAVIETKAIQQALEKMIRECAGSSGSAALTVPINIGIGTK
jgi:hypothetical protein